MKKGVIILIISLVIIIGLIIGAIIYKNSNRISYEDYKKTWYSYTVCIYNCPIDNNLQGAFPNEECQNGCKSQFKIISKNLYAQKLGGDDLAKDIIINLQNTCRNNVNFNKSFESIEQKQKFVDCFRVELNNLKEKYSYL